MILTFSNCFSRESLLRERFEITVRQHEEEDASIRRDHESAVEAKADRAALPNIEELNRRADSAAGGADVAEWENLRADYSWALEEARRVLEVSESLRAFECWITIHIDDRIFIWL